MVCLQHDADMAQRVADAAAAGRKLVYVGSVDVASGACSVSLEVILHHAPSCPQHCMPPIALQP